MRSSAENDYPLDQLERAASWWASLDDIRAMLARYERIGETELRANLSRFLQAVIPTAEQHPPAIRASGACAGSLSCAGSCLACDRAELSSSPPRACPPRVR